MADVALLIGGQQYRVSCRDGEEEHLREIARLVDAKTKEAKSAIGEHMSDTRQLLFAALLLADELDERRKSGEEATEPDDAGLARLESLAERLESVSGALVPGDRGT